MKVLSKKLPTFIGLIILLIGVVAGVLLVRNRQLLSPRAGPVSLEPQNIKISNVQIDTFVVSFTTAEDTPAFIVTGPNPELSIENSDIFLDNRDQLYGTLNPYKTHYFTIANGRSQNQSNFDINPDSKYYFKIGLGEPEGNKQLFDNLGQPFEITTAVNPIDKPADIISGNVKNQSGANINGALVYLALPGATMLSDLIKDGSFVIPINTAYSLDLNQAAQYDSQATNIEILIQGEKLTSTITSITAVKNIPDIVLGQNYDFTTRPSENEPTKKTKEEDVPSATESATLTPTEPPSQKESGFDLSGSTIADRTVPAQETNDLAITNPTKDNESVATQKPEFRGTGPANQIITIRIESDPIVTASTTVNSNGVWSYSPPEDLDLGNHTIIVSYLTDTGEEIEVFRPFSVAYAAETDLPSFTSTPSATIVPEPTDTPIPTNIPTLIPTSIPTISPQITATPTTTFRSTMPSTESGVPTSGSIGPTVWLMLAGMTLFIFGIRINYKKN
jgi:hypothetical protein